MNRMKNIGLILCGLVLGLKTTVRLPKTGY